jgi:hypothetical protein
MKHLSGPPYERCAAKSAQRNRPRCRSRSTGNGWIRSVDPNDPPILESEVSYLERHGLLLPGERQRLRKADFEPVTVTLED